MTNYPVVRHLVSNLLVSLVLYQDDERPGSLSPFDTSVLSNL